MDADSALRMLGKYSRWQLRTYFIYAFGFGIPFAWMVMSVVFIGDTPNFRCALPPNATLNESIPSTCDVTGKCEYDKCHMFNGTSVSNQTIPCQYGYWFDPTSGYASTLVTEFELVCGKGYLVEAAMILNGFGAVLGAIVFPLLSDAYGRKKIFLFTLWTNIIVAITQAFSVNMVMYTALGFIDGLQQQGQISAACVLAMELFPQEQRTFAGVAIEFFWALGYVLIVPLAYWFRNWRHLQLAISVPLLLTISFYWFIAESIPWLVANQKQEQAEKIIQKAAKINKLDNFPSHVFTENLQLISKNKNDSNDIILQQKINSNEADSTLLETESNSSKFGHSKDNVNHKNKRNLMSVLDRIQEATVKVEPTANSEPSPKYKIWDLFRSRKMFLYSLTLWFVWLINSLGYGAMVLTVTYLPGDRYINTLLYALMEVPAYIVLWIALFYGGRRWPIFIFHLLGGVALIGTIIQTFDFQVDLSGLVVFLSVTGKFGYTCTFAAIYAQAPELFPTNLRNTGLGLCQAFARLGSLLAPLFRILARSKPFLPPLIIGSASILAGFLILILPETRYEPLPTTIEQIEKFERKLTKNHNT